MERKKTAKDRTRLTTAKHADNEQIQLEMNSESEKKDQLNQKSNSIKEKTNNKEIKTKDSIKGDTKDEFITSAECSDQISNIKTIFKNCSLIKKLTDRYGEEKVHQIEEQIERIDLVEFLKAKGHSFFPKRIVNVKNIMQTIESWLQYLHCSVKGCPYNAIITYKGESSDQIYCQAHKDPSKNTDEQIVLQNELNECELLLRELEKELLYVQAKIIFVKNENEGNNRYEIIMEDLENKFLVIKSTLNTMIRKVDNLTEKSNTKKTAK